MSRMLDAALEYTKKGVSVFPVHGVKDGRCLCGRNDCVNAGKHPIGVLVPHGFKDATTDEATIRRWWAREPDANIATPTSWGVVLDVDPRHGGDDTLAELEQRYGRLPDTAEVLTGGGGRHVYFARPPVRIASSSGKLGSGLDIKADGGYVLLPPSKHVSGRLYCDELEHPLFETPLAPMPPWMLTLATAPTATDGATPQETVDWGALLGGAPEGKRHETAVRIAGHFLGKGLPAAEVEQIVLGFASRCMPAFPAPEAKRIVGDLASKHAAPAEAAGSSAADQLIIFGGLTAESPIDEVEVRLRMLAKSLNGADPLRRRIVRDKTVKRLEELGVRAPAELARLALADGGADDSDLQGHAIAFTDPEPWPAPVDGAALADAISNLFTGYAVLPEGAATALALWVLHAHAHNAADVSPYCAVTSPVKRCGKTTICTALAALVPRPLPVSNITAASLFRAVEKYSPTLLVDEADTFISESEELRGLLNSGHSRAMAYAVRTVGEDREARTFSTWCPKVIALIGRLPDTLADRSIVIQMRRRAKTENVKRLRLDRLHEWEPLRRQAWRWAQDNLTRLRASDPAVPEDLDDRGADNWRPLFAIADLLGGEWPAQAREVARLLSGEARQAEDTGGVMLLGDLRRLFTERRTARLPSVVIVEELGKLEERPWSEWRRGKPITARQLARQLESFSISPKKVRVGDQTLRGYELEQFEDAFSRYLPPDDPPHPEQINENAQLALEIDPPHGGGVADGKQQTSIDEPSNVPDVPWCDAVGEYHDTREERST